MSTLLSLKQLCMLAAAGGIGAGSTVAVQKIGPKKARPPAHRAAPAKPPVRRAVHRTALPRKAPLAAVLQEAKEDLPVDCVPAGALPATQLVNYTVPGGGEQQAGTPIGTPDGGYNGGGGGLGSPAPLGTFAGFSPPPAGGTPPTPGSVSTVVPEPRSWALVASGVGVLGLAVRTKRRRDEAPPTPA